MRLYNLRPPQMRAAVLLATLGFTADNGASDHAAGSAATQTIKIGTIKPGQKIYPDVIVDIITPYAHASTVTVAVGITGTVDRFVAASDAKSATAKAYGGTTATHALPYINQSGADVDLIVTFVAGATTMSAITAGEIRIRVHISRRGDRVEGQA